LSAKRQQIVSEASAKRQRAVSVRASCPHTLPRLVFDILSVRFDLSRVADTLSALGAAVIFRRRMTA
jgi:hypothetical protein